MRKSPRNSKKAPLLPIPVAFDRVAVDILGPFPVSRKGSRYICVFSDYLSRWCEAFPVPSAEASVIARLLVDEVISRHGAPKVLLSDREKNLLSKLIAEVCKIFQIHKVNTSSITLSQTVLLKDLIPPFASLSQCTLPKIRRTGMSTFL